MKLAPVIIFCYKRKDHLEMVIDSLKENLGAEDSILYVYSDGAKGKDDLQQVIELRNYLKSISGFYKVIIIEREKNLGLAENIISGVTEVLDKFGKAIILEDDLVTSPFFLKYMNSALDFYECNDQVISIHGYVYPILNLPDYYFLKGADCWGWATWKRGWDLFEKDGKVLLDEIKKNKLEMNFDYDSSYPFTKMLEDQVERRNDSWAIRWYASAYLKNMYTLYPGISYVSNIGLDGSGTHCTPTKYFDTNIVKYGNWNFPKKVVEDKEVRKQFALFFKSMQGSLPHRVLLKLRRLISKLNPKK